MARAEVRREMGPPRAGELGPLAEGDAGERGVVPGRETVSGAAVGTEGGCPCRIDGYANARSVCGLSSDMRNATVADS